MKVNALKIERILAARQLTKSQLSAACGISRQNLSTIIMRGTAEPKTIGKIAHGLGVDVAELMEDQQ